MTLGEYRRMLARLPAEWDGLEVQGYCDDQNFYHDPRRPTRETLRMGEFAGQKQWLDKDWVDDDKAQSKDIVLL